LANSPGGFLPSAGFSRQGFDDLARRQNRNTPAGFYPLEKTPSRRG
jgi:hypothetical protein